MNKLKLLIYILLVFILFNAIIVFLWPIRTNLKFSNFSPYSKEFVSDLNLKNDEALQLYLETWQRDRLFEYDEFTGIRESEIKDGKYVNISKNNGRLISNNPKECNQNIFFYGGEIVFGYDVTDDQTIPFYLRNLSERNNIDNCIYNFGRRTYFSLQENILFQKHIMQNKIKEGDIIIFINGENEQGNSEIINTKFISENYNDLHQKYWKLYKSGIKYFITLLPIYQFIEVITKDNVPTEMSTTDNNLINPSFEDVNKVYNNNLNIRNGICYEFHLDCYNFLFFVNPNKNKKYEMLKKNNNIYDLSMFSENMIQNKFNSISPAGNETLAKQIYNLIN